MIGTDQSTDNRQMDDEGVIRAALAWLDARSGDTSVDWLVLPEPRRVTAVGIDSILASQGTDAAARITGILACSAVEPTPEELQALLPEPLMLVVAELLPASMRLLSLTSVMGGGASTTEAAQRPEALRRMTLAMAGDIRVILVRLAAGLHALRADVTYAREQRRAALTTEAEAGADAATPDAAAPDAPPVNAPPVNAPPVNAPSTRADSVNGVSAAMVIQAREARAVLAPLANRLGLFQLKWEIEDLSFRLLDPDGYRMLASGVATRRAEREAVVRSSRSRLEAALAQAGIKATVAGRPKHLYSIAQKMRQKDLDLEGLHDLIGLRVLVNTVGDCYAALDVVHTLWRQIPSEFDDYISRPKPNGYQSLHTVVVGEDGHSLEVQIRTRAMHELAEFGVAAHWRYKEGGAPAQDPGTSKITWLRQLLAWQQETGAALGSEGGSTHDDARIFTLTPQGRIIELPAGATPVDFAYHVHSTLGHRCRGAKVDGRLVPLNTPLVNGQVVEIVTARRGAATGPSRDWLNPTLGFVHSARARTKVRQWFHAQEREVELATGRERVEKALAREGRTALGFEALAQRLGLPGNEALFIAVAHEDIGPRALEDAIRGQADMAAAPAAAGSLAANLPQAAGQGPGGVSGPAGPGGPARPALPIASPPSRSAQADKGHGVRVVGVDFLLTQLARCCHPAPPDAIVGFVTRGKGVSIHRQGCPALQALKQRSAERVLEVDWGDWRAQASKGSSRGSGKERRYPVAVQIEARDRPGLLRDIGEVLARDRNNVLSVRSQTHGDGARLTLIIEVTSSEALASVFDQITRIEGVFGCRRL